MKADRQAKIIDLITTHPLQTQEELTQLLIDEGFKVTQATVSRDIRDLRLSKITFQDGTQRYGLPKHAPVSSSNYNYKTIVSEAIKAVDYALNFVCVKCPTGLANAACAAFDELHWDGVIGTLSGDDTFFIMCRTPEYAERISNELKKYIGKL